MTTENGESCPCCCDDQPKSVTLSVVLHCPGETAADVSQRLFEELKDQPDFESVAVTRAEGCECYNVAYRYSRGE